MPRIFWQSFIDQSASRAYMDRLGEYLNGIASAGVTVDVRGISPPDRDFSRLSETRCALLAIDNALQAEEDGYDAFVMGHFQDPLLYELRSALSIPVIGVGEATMFAGLQLGRRLGLVTLDPVFEVMHLEQADRYGIGHRVVEVAGLGIRPEDFSAAFAGDAAARDRLLERFVDVARPMVGRGVDVILPAGVLPGLLLCGRRSMKVGHAPVLNCASVALKSAEMWIALHGLDGVEPSRGPGFALAPARARADFRSLVASGRNDLRTGG